MNDTGLGIDLTAMIEQAVGQRFQEHLGNADGYHITLSQDGKMLQWANLKSLSRLTIQVTGWDEPVMEETK